MKKIKNVWTLVYKESDSNPLAFTYTSKEDAIAAKHMVEDSDGDELIDSQGNVDGCIEIEWCYLIYGKLIDSD